MTMNKKFLTALILSSLYTGSLAVFAADLPSFFDWRLTTPTDRNSTVTDSIVPAIRNQGKHGTCWTFGSFGSYETNWNLQLRQAGNTTASAPYFSSRYMNWVTFDATLDNDPATLLHYEITNPEALTHPFPERAYNAGGSYLLATGSLIRYGAVLNSQCLYDTKENAMAGVDHVIAPSGLLHDTLFATPDPTNSKYYINKSPDYYKKLITTYGALAVSYYDPVGEPDAEKTEKGDEICNHTKTSTDHAVCLVGWDDDYVFRNFTNADGTALKGAWILRNSWGTSAGGNGGYFYMSYKDTSLCRGAIQIPELDSRRYTQVNTLSPLGIIDSNVLNPNDRSISFANKLTASASQLLKAVGVYASNDAMSFQVSVRLKGTSPTDGNEVYTQKGTFGVDGLSSYGGYRTIDLKKFIYLPDKENYIVTVTLTDKNNNSIAVPLSYVDGVDVLSHPIAANSSFIFDTTSNTWIDTKDQFLKNKWTDSAIPMNGLAKDSNLANGGDFTVVSLNDYGAGGSSIYLGKANELYSTDILHPDRNTLSNMTVELTKGLTDSWYGGIISGEGSVTKTGDGMLALSGANTYTGATNVNAGSMALTGSLQSPVTVASGATLTGTGTINGDLTNKGTLVPGLNADAQSLLGTTNPIGTLTVNGNLNSTGALQIAVIGTDNSKLAVSGASALVGTTFAIADQYNNPLPNHAYTYLTSQNGITGNVATTQVSPYISLSSVIDGNNGILTATQTQTLGSLPGMTPSENSVGNALNKALLNHIANNPNAASTAEMNSLLYQNTATSRKAMKQVTNATQATLIAVSPLTAMTIGATYDRLDTALFDGNVDMNVPGASFDGVPLTIKTTAPMTLDTANNLWFKLLRGYEYYGGTNGGYDLDNKSFGGVIGYDRAVNGTTRVGGLFSYAKTDYSTDVLDGKSHDWRVGVYASHDNGTWKTQGLISYGHNRYDFNRYVLSDKLYSNYTAKVFDINAKVKYLPQYNRAKSWQVAPYVALAYTHTSQDAYTEDGGTFTQSMDSASNNSYRAEAGVEWKHDMNKDSSFGGSVGYKRVLSGVNPELNGTFAGDTTNFTLYTDNDRNYVTYSMNLKKNTGHNWTVQGEVRGEKSAHNHSEVYSLMAKYAF